MLKKPAPSRRGSSSPKAPARAAILSADGRRIIEVLSSLIEPIGRALPGCSEIVLHDLSLVPNTIINIYGELSGRRVGDPGTDLLLRQSIEGFPDRYLGYETALPDGRPVRSWTMIVRDTNGTAVAALCINTDIAAWRVVAQIAETMIGTDGEHAVSPIPVPATAPIGVSEHFVRNVDELASHLIHRSIAEVGRPVAEMRKEHKIDVVRRLQKQGFFQLREAVEMLAEVLGVTRFTVYNYINELNGEAGPE